MKKKLFLACLFITSLVATQAQNLIENGSFEDGLTNWTGGNIAVRNYVGTVDGAHYLQSQDSYGFGYYNANARYTKEVATNVEGKTYKYSLWIPKTTNVSNLKGNIQVKDSNNGGIYTSVDGKSFGAFTFTATGEEKNNWKELAIELKLPDNAHTISGLGFSISAVGIKVDNIIFEEVKQIHPAPTNLEVAKVYQREAKITWDAIEGATAYSVKVGEAEAVEVTETSYMATGLTPGATVKVIVKSAQEDAQEAEVEVKTEAITTAEADRIPYILLSEDGNIQNPFIIHVYDATNAPTIKSVSLDDTTVEPVNGAYSFQQGTGRILKVVLTEGDQEWRLEYKGINVQ